MQDDHSEESSDGTLARGDDHSNYTHKQDYVEVIDDDVRWRMIIMRSRQMVLITPLDMILKGLLIVHYELQCCETSRIYSK